MGGGVDFGETSLEAVKREFQEEIQAELKKYSLHWLFRKYFHFQR